MDSGKLALRVWLEWDTMQNLRAIAGKRRMTLGQAVSVAIAGEWDAAGRP